MGRWVGLARGFGPDALLTLTQIILVVEGRSMRRRAQGARPLQQQVRTSGLQGYVAVARVMTTR